MANQEHLAILKQGVKAWNKWRKENPEIVPDLTGANLTRANLTEADLAEANLTRANIDFAAWPLWCGSANVKIDERIARQLLAHAFQVAGEFCPPTPEQVDFCNGYHRIQSGEFPEIKLPKQGGRGYETPIQQGIKS